MANKSMHLFVKVTIIMSVSNYAFQKIKTFKLCTGVTVKVSNNCSKYIYLW